MGDLPDDVELALARGVAAYLRATPANELPPAWGPVKRTVQTAKGLGRQKERLLAALEDDVMRALLLEWLDDGKPPLSRPDVELLRLATERPEGFNDRLRAASKPKPDVSKPPQKGSAAVEQRLEREREAARKAKEEARRARQEADAKVTRERARAEAAQEEARSRSEESRALRKELAIVKESLAQTRKELERERRRARGALEKAEADLERLRRELKEARAERTRLKAQLERAAAKAPAKARRPAQPERSGPRPVLRPSKGRFEDDPETLDEWLAVPGVQMVVDGYNVTRHTDGFAHLSLEAQRDRLQELLKALAARRKVPTVLVWDGGDPPPAAPRSRHGRLKIEFSAPATSPDHKDRADRHIIEVVKALPADPVIVVSNDRELQEAVRRERATVATADQLLRLLR